MSYASEENQTKPVAPTPYGTLLQMAGHRGAPWVENEQTRNWPNCTDHHESAHQNDQLYFYSQKSGGARPQKIFRRLCLPHFQIRFGATIRDNVNAPFLRLSVLLSFSLRRKTRLQKTPRVLKPANRIPSPRYQ